MAWHENLKSGSPQLMIAKESRSPMRVMAGPGTGKTFTLQRRVARLLAEGCDPKRILAVTFTRIAAEDMYREMKAIGVEGCEDVRACTLHSLCFQLLNRAEVFSSTGRTPRALNAYETEPLLYDLDEKRFGDKRKRRKRIQAFEAAWARQQYEQAGAARNEIDIDFETLLNAWNLFHKAMLIGELIPVLLRYLQRNPLALERTFFDHVLVDEFQDLNKAEQLIVDELANSGTLSVIGDDDQSIYSFKHAHPEGIREFHASHTETVTYGLDLCYRCPTRVVEMANSLIRHNLGRMTPPRALVPIAENGDGDIDIIQFNGVAEEAQYIAAEIRQKIESHVVVPGKVLVLTPRRILGTQIRGFLELEGIPAMSCFQEDELNSKVAQERLAILKLAVNKYDRVALRWSLGCKSQGFLKNQYAILRAYCEKHASEPWDTLESVCAGKIEIKKIANLRKRFEQIKSDIATIANTSMVDFTDIWLPENMEDVHDLRRMTELAISRGEATNIEKLLEIVIETITQPVTPERIDEVRIMSLHKSKGLSGHMVVVAGCVDGLLPRRPGDDMDPADVQRHMEEQRRLFYVAITRTKSQKGGNTGILRITSALEMGIADAKRMGANVIQYARRKVAVVAASPFLDELGPHSPGSRGG